MTDTSAALDVRSLTDLPAHPSIWRIEPYNVGSGFRERGEYRIRKPTSGDRLFIDDQAIESDNGEWAWMPGFYAGQVRAELLGPDDRVRATYLLDVSPDPDKLGRDMFQIMLSQIWDFDSSLVFGTEPAALPVGHGEQVSDPWLEYVRLRAHGERFVRVLSAIARRPLLELKAERTQLPLQHVRRADRQTGLAALRNPQLLPIFAHRPFIAAQMNALPPFDVPVARETLDGAGNRCMAEIAQRVSHRAVQLRNTLQRVVRNETESDTRTALAARWPRRRDFLDRIVRQLYYLQRVSPLADVSKREISAAGLTAISADPTYSSAYGSGWRILRRGVEGPRDDERIWVSPTWEIYERWCFVQLGNAIEALMPEFHWSGSRNYKSKAKAAFTGSKGGKVRIEVLLQPKFPAGDLGWNNGFQSISGTREPDIVLTRTDEHVPKWYVFDAKYRTTRPSIVEAMASAHVYRDGLRWHGRRPECAVLLVPRGGGAPWLEQPDFISRHRVGVCALGADSNPQSVFQSLFGEDFWGRFGVAHDQ